MFIYDYRSPILAATDQIHPMEQLLFPFMHFTCSGSITRLMFVANRSRESSQNVVTSWPVFSLWHHNDATSDNFLEVRSMGPLSPCQITSLQPASRSMRGNRQVEVVMINFTSPVSFVAGDILGLRQNDTIQYQYQYNNSNTKTGTFLLSRSIRVLRQSGGGYGLALTCNEWDSSGCTVDTRVIQEVPYIAIETSKSCM